MRISDWSSDVCSSDLAVALAAPGRAPLTYRALQKLVGRTVDALNDFGIGRNDRVAIVLPNGPEMAAAFVAIGTGATTAPLNPAYRAEELEFYITDLRAKAVVVPAGEDGTAVQVAAKRSEEDTSALQQLMRTTYAVFL